MPRYLWIGLAALAGCGEVTALPDSSTDSIDAAPVIDAPPSPLPREATGVALADLGLVPSATVAAGTARITVGTQVTNLPNERDGLLVTLSPTEAPSAWRFDGGANDQFLAVAATESQFAALGLTRSFLGGLQQDQALGVFGTTSDETVTVRSYFVATDEFLQLRAAAANGPSGWVMGGTHLAGARGFVMLTDATGEVTRAITFTPEVNASEVRVRKLISVGGAIIVIGRAVRGAVPFGFVLQLDGVTLAARQVRGFESSEGVELLDAVVEGTSLRVVGSTPTAGLSLLLSPSGDATQLVEWPLHRLATVTPTSAGLFVAGSVGGGSFAGILDGTNLRGVVLSGLTPTAISPDRLVAGPVAAAFYGVRGGNLVEVPLNDTPVGACNDVALGAPTSTAATASSATPFVPVVEIRDLAVQAPIQPVRLVSVTATTIDACVF